MHRQCRFLLPAAQGAALALLASCAPGTEKVWDAVGATTGSMLQQEGVLTGVGGTITANVMAQSGTLVSSLDISDERDRAMADYVHDRFMTASHHSRDAAMEDYLNRMARWIASNGAKNFDQYRVVLLEDDTPNAFTPGGGWIFVTTGLLEIAQNESQVAMVLAHEIAHIIVKHPLRSARDNAVMKVAFESIMIAGASAGAMDDAGEQLFTYTTNAMRSGHGREFESEADRLGLELLVRSQYDPREAPRFFEALINETGDQDAASNFFYGRSPDPPGARCGA